MVRLSPEGEGSDDETSDVSRGDAVGCGGVVCASFDAWPYFLTRFASAEGKNGGQFYTPQCVVRVLVSMLAPYKRGCGIRFGNT